MDIITNIRQQPNKGDELSFREEAALRGLMLTGTLIDHQKMWLGRFDFSKEFEERLSIPHSSIKELESKFEDIQLKIRMKAGMILEQFGAIREHTTMEELKREGWDENHLNKLKGIETGERISEVNIFSLKEGGYAIRCKINGIQQPSEKLSREDIVNLTEKTDRKALAEKYFHNVLTFIKLKNQGVAIRCKIDGEQQCLEKLTPKECLEWEGKMINKEGKELFSQRMVEKYFLSSLNSERQKGLKL